jgi:hypothetical protein
MAAIETPPTPPPPGQGRMVLFGMLLTLLLHLLQVPLAGGLGLLVSLWSKDIGVVFYMSPLAIGLTQLVYMIPAILIARTRGKPGLVKGLLIGAALTLLLNGLCFGVVLLGMGNIGR